MSKVRFSNRLKVFVIIALIAIFVFIVLIPLKGGVRLYHWYSVEKSLSGIKKEIPSSVKSKYSERLESSYKVTIEACTNNEGKIYVVTAFNISPTYYYYYEDGTYIGEYFISDVAGEDAGTPPVNISEYSCQVEVKS